MKTLLLVTAGYFLYALIVFFHTSQVCDVNDYADNISYRKKIFGRLDFSLKAGLIVAVMLYLFYFK